MESSLITIDVSMPKTEAMLQKLELGVGLEPGTGLINQAQEAVASSLRRAEFLAPLAERAALAGSQHDIPVPGFMGQFRDRVERQISAQPNAVMAVVCDHFGFGDTASTYYARLEGTMLENFSRERGIERDYELASMVFYRVLTEPEDAEISRLLAQEIDDPAVALSAYYDLYASGDTESFEPFFELTQALVQELAETNVVYLGKNLPLVVEWLGEVIETVVQTEINHARASRKIQNPEWRKQMREELASGAVPVDNFLRFTRVRELSDNLITMLNALPSTKVSGSVKRFVGSLTSCEYPNDNLMLGLS